MAFTKIAAAGIGTTETVTVDGLTVINNGSFGGNLSVGGTLTYEDVTNVDSVGLITARNGIVVGSGITLSKDGDVFFTGIATGNGSGLTNIPAANITGTLPAIDGSALTGMASTDNVRTGILDVAGVGTFRGNIFQTGGRIVRGSTSTIQDGDAIAGGVNITGTDMDASVIMSVFGNDNDFNRISGAKSRNATIGSHTVVNDGDTLLSLKGFGSDGTDFEEAAQLEFQVDGSPGDNDMPGRMVFKTTADGAASPTERLRISSSGQLSTGSETAPDVSAGGLCLNQGAADTNIFSLKSSDIAHGVTTYDETDTYFSIRKSSGNKGGARIHGFTDAAGGDPALEFQGVIASDADQGYCPIEFKGSEANGTGVQNIATNRRIVNVKNSDGTRIASFTGTGLTFGDDHAIDNALDDYEEGTYVATIYGSSTGTGAPFGMNPTNLRYTKVGRVVHVTGRVYINSSSNNPTGSARMLLPFTSAPNGTGHDGQGYSYVTRYNVYSPNNDWNLCFEVDPNASYGVFLWDKPGSAWDAATADGHINQNAAYYGFDFSYTTPT